MQFLAELSKIIGVATKFIDMTRDDVLCYLDKCRKPENEDPLHKWIGSYNTQLVIISRFFKWLYYPNIDNPKRRSKLSLVERKPDNHAAVIIPHIHGIVFCIPYWIIQMNEGKTLVDKYIKRETG